MDKDLCTELICARLGAAIAIAALFAALEQEIEPAIDLGAIYFQSWQETRNAHLKVFESGVAL